MRSETSAAEIQLLELSVGGREGARIHKHALQEPAGDFSKAAAD
jgi:hypothetical protein